MSKIPDKDHIPIEKMEEKMYEYKKISNVQRLIIIALVSLLGI